jgi:hypothetical protein
MTMGGRAGARGCGCFRNLEPTTCWRAAIVTIGQRRGRVTRIVIALLRVPAINLFKITLPKLSEVSIFFFD